MKLFLIGFGSVVAEHAHVAEELAKRHEILYWLYMYGAAASVNQKQFPGTIFHDHRDALKGVPSEAIDSSHFEPWSKDKLVSFSAVESEVMSMMDKWYPDWPVLKRRDFYYELLRYWGGVLEQLKPDAILLVDVPHSMFDFVLYEIAKRRGIRTIMLDPVFRGDRLVTYEDFREGNKTLSSWRQGAKKSSLEELTPATREYYLEISGSQNPSPVHFTEWRRENSGIDKLRRHTKALIPFIKDGSILERGINRVFKLLKPNVRDEYHALERTADLRKPYVYVPLHYQPELTTSPQGGVFVDQVLMVQTLATALPKDWELYIKEHPAQWMAHGGDFTSYRYRGIYESMARIKGVRIVPISTNTFTLIDNAKIVATATGTAAMEAVLRRKSAVIFGYPWFMHAPGISRVSCVEDCRKAFAGIAGGEVTDQQEILNYLKVVEETSFRGYTAGEGAHIASYAKSEAWPEILKALEGELVKHT